MKTRQLEILRIIKENRKVEYEKILDIYEMSKRTLFYDLEEINFAIKKFASLNIEDKYLIFNEKINFNNKHFMDSIVTPYFDLKERQDYILLRFFETNDISVDYFANKFQVTKKTIYNDIAMLRNELSQNDINFYYDKNYYIDGSEKNIRNKYVSLLSLTEFNFSIISRDILKMNREEHLNLSDFSMYYLTKLIQFIKARNEQGYEIQKNFISMNTIATNKSLDIRKYVAGLSKLEAEYLTLFLLSLLNTKENEINGYVSEYVDKLLIKIKTNLALDVEWSKNFKINLINHLVTSYCRIKCQFPALNTLLTEIKVKYFYLYANIHKIVKSLDVYPFNQMRDEEIGYVVSYIGGYLYQDLVDIESTKVIIVCPQGRAVSKHLKWQIEKRFKGIKILGTHSVDAIGNLSSNYDYIISTIELPHLENVIKINPILLNSDINLLKKYFVERDSKQLLIEELNKIIDKYCVISNKAKLDNALEEFIKNRIEGKGFQPMLEELITEERIQKVDTVDNWEKAIWLASEPLLKDGSIENRYVEMMIENVYKYGPYIVLTDGFALPHASASVGVNRLAMSLLSLENPVTIMEKDVYVFAVLATIDNESHLKALIALTDIISDEEKLEAIKNGNVEEILKIVKGGSA